MRHYKTIAAAEVNEALVDAECVTTAPRYSLDGSQAITRWTSAQAGGLTHAEARALVQTSDWQVADNG